MHPLIFISQIIIVLLLSGCNDQSPVIIEDLRCEYLTNPIGIGNSMPGLSWKIRSASNGTFQKAYQVIVSNDSNFPDEENADLWDSGKILSSESVLIPYTGPALASNSVCYWKVRIWDRNDELSEWSQTGTFSVGLLSESDWKADYIGLPGLKGNISPLLRKSINITEKGERIFIHVNSLGYHEVYINGMKIGNNVLTPAVSQFNKRSHSITYDITSETILGRNDIVLWSGKGWYSKGLPGVVNDGPLVRAQVEKYSKGASETITFTDSLWLGRNSGYSDSGTWRPGEFGGEIVDGSLIMADLTGPSLDNESWSRVSVAEVPGHEVTPQLAESNIITDSIKPASIVKTGENVWMADMGTTLTGWTAVKFHSLKQGQKIILEYCDHLDKDGNFVDQGQKDQYLASGNEEGESFCNKFNYHGYRYLKISGLNSEPRIEEITSLPIRTGYRIASSFECSDKDLNDIHDMIFYTLQCLSLGGYLVDCPQIERLGYGGDGNASTETAQTMFDLYPLYSNWLQAWADCVREDGGMPHTAPNPYPAGGGPYWCGFIITATWKTFQNYADKRILEKYYPVMLQWLSYVEKFSTAGLLQPWPETNYRSWYLGDWASPEGVDHTNKSSVTLVNNCFIAVCYDTMEKIARVLGKNDDVRKFSEKSNEIKKLVHNEFFDSIENIYASGIQVDLTYPLLAGVVPDSLKSQVTTSLFNEINKNRNGHIATGLVGIPVFTEWVIKEHEADLMYSILKTRGYPGYLYMIDNGATTTWEHWNGARSWIHNCYNGIGSWFYEALGGIRKDENFPGYRHILIDPQITEGITWANTTKETPYGQLSVRWKIESGNLVIDIVIPAGCTASIKVPSGGKNCKLNGKDIDSSQQAWIDVENGRYYLKCNL